MAVAFSVPGRQECQGPSAMQSFTPSPWFNPDSLACTSELSPETRCCYQTAMDKSSGKQTCFAVKGSSGSLEPSTVHCAFHSYKCKFLLPPFSGRDEGAKGGPWVENMPLTIPSCTQKLSLSKARLSKCHSPLTDVRILFHPF